MHIKHLSIYTCLLFLCLAPDRAWAVLGFSFRNFSMGTGISRVFSDIQYDEVPFYMHNDPKNSFLIDLRFDFRRHMPGRFVPSLSFFRWSKIPNNELREIETSIDNFDLNIDYHYFLGKYNRWIPYIGSGLSLHMTHTQSTFPGTYFEKRPTIIKQITENSVRPGYNLIVGTDIEVGGDFVMFSEIRYDISSNFSQLKYLIGISTY